MRTIILFLFVWLSLIARSEPINSVLGASKTSSIGTDYIPTAADYIHEGLVAMWDGIENIDYGVHDSSSTTWYDLIGERDALLTNVGHFGDDSLICGGGEQTDGNSRPSARCSSIIPQEDLSTVEIVYRISSRWGYSMDGTKGPQVLFGPGRVSGSMMRGGFIYFGQTSEDTTKMLYIGTTASSLLAWYIDTSDKFNKRLSISAVYSQTIEEDRGVDFWYKNGDIQTTTRSKIPDRRSPSLLLTFGGICNSINYGRYNWFYGMSGEICNVRVYNRQLTPIEVSYNYKIDKARFGL